MNGDHLKNGDPITAGRIQERHTFFLILGSMPGCKNPWILFLVKLSFLFFVGGDSLKTNTSSVNYCICFCLVRKFVDWGCNSNDVGDLNIPVVNYQEWSQILALMPSKISVVFHRMSHK